MPPRPWHQTPVDPLETVPGTAARNGAWHCRSTRQARSVVSARTEGRATLGRIVSEDPMSRTSTRDRRAHLVLASVSAVLVLTAGAAAFSGRPVYVNFYGQIVSSYLALALGVLGLIYSFLPAAPESKGKARREGPSQRCAPSLPGRNEPCHCGSGSKYKKCCLRADRDARLRAHWSRRRSRLNHSRGVSSVTGLVNRGLQGR